MKVKKIRDNVRGSWFARYRSAFSKGDATVNTYIIHSKACLFSAGCFGLLNRNSLRSLILSKLVPVNVVALLPKPLLLYSNRLRNYPLFSNLILH